MCAQPPDETKPSTALVNSNVVARRQSSALPSFGTKTITTTSIRDVITIAVRTCNVRGDDVIKREGSGLEQDDFDWL